MSNSHPSPGHAKQKQTGKDERKPARKKAVPPAARDDDEPPAAPGSAEDFSHGESLKTDQQDHITANRQ